MFDWVLSMPLGLSVFHERNGLELCQWQSDLINLTPKMVCVHMRNACKTFKYGANILIWKYVKELIM